MVILGISGIVILIIGGIILAALCAPLIYAVTMKDKLSTRSKVILASIPFVIIGLLLLAVAAYIIFVEGL